MSGTTTETDRTINAPYSAFAAAYSSGAEREFSRSMATFARQVAERFGGPHRAVLDIACGIGAACERSAEAGLDVTGVDASNDMLAIARTSAQASGLPITYLRQDMREVSVQRPVDLVTCMYDSLNAMLTETDLLAAFAAARGALRVGGLYIFDLYTVHGLSVTWGTKDEIHTDNATHFVATRTHWIPETTSNTKSLWGFDRRADGWSAWREEHVARAHEVTVIKHLLALVGFHVESVHGWRDLAVTPLEPDSDRVVFVASASA